jgi:glutathione S-transferase
MLKLHVFPPSPRAFKVLALAHHIGLDYEIKMVDLTKGDQNRPEHVALNPNHKMPVLEHDGVVLWESNAILQYLGALKPESGVLPHEREQWAKVNQWQFWEAAHWDPACARFAFENLGRKLLGLGEPDPDELAKAGPEFHRFAAVLNETLAKNSFVTGSQLTIADFSIGAWLTIAQPAKYPLDTYLEIQRWYGELSKLPGWRQALASAHH